MIQIAVCYADVILFYWDLKSDKEFRLQCEKISIGVLRASGSGAQEAVEILY